MFQRRPPHHVAAALFKEGVAVHEVWPYVLAIFICGGALTALGLTILSDDFLVLAGIVLTSVGIACMWLPGRGAVRSGKAFAVGAFLSGNFSTATALTLSTSNRLLLVGMILSAVGIASMWFIGVGKRGPLPMAIWAAFVLGTSLQAVGLTVFPAGPLVGAGMVLVSGGIFGMWLQAHPAPAVADFERAEVMNRANEGAIHAAGQMGDPGAH